MAWFVAVRAVETASLILICCIKHKFTRKFTTVIFHGFIHTLFNDKQCVNKTIKYYYQCVKLIQSKNPAVTI